jgi:sugar fermentation stimulation protein A
MTNEHISGEKTLSPRVSIQFGELVPARFVRRDNRFVVQVEYQNENHPAHLANPGRLKELLTPAQRLWVHPVDDPSRKTRLDVVLVEMNQTLVSVNSQLPNQLVARALNAGTLPGTQEIQRVHREVKYHHSRIDFVAEEGQGHRLRRIEVKSVTLVTEGIAMFPDAPTQRGTRHLHELRSLVQDGGCAVVIFVIQRKDACMFTPNDEMDPAFGTALRSAVEAGVEVHALRCRITRNEIGLDREIPVCLDSSMS